MIVWIMVAAVISFIGHPLVRFFDGFRIRKWHMPHTLSTLLALLTIVMMFAGLLAIFVPLIISEARTISKIDINLLAKNLESPLLWIDDELHAFGIIPAEQTFQDFIVSKAKSLVNVGSVTTMLNNFFSDAGTAFVGIF